MVGILKSYRKTHAQLRKAILAKSTAMHLQNTTISSEEYKAKYLFIPSAMQLEFVGG